MSSLFFTKAAAARLLPFATRIEAVRVFTGAIQVTYLTKNGRCSTFLSKTGFCQDFVAFRQEGAKSCTVRQWGAGSYQCRYEVFSGKSEKIYSVELAGGLAMCSCPDYERQYQELGKAKPGCKHVIATLSRVGYSSIAEYMGAVSNRAKADLYDGGWDELIQQPTATTQLV
jgi:predicted nucleic acid-binding Zn finger protein